MYGLNSVSSANLCTSQKTQVITHKELTLYSVIPCSCTWRSPDLCPDWQCSVSGPDGAVSKPRVLARVPCYRALLAPAACVPYWPRSWHHRAATGADQRKTETISTTTNTSLTDLIGFRSNRHITVLVVNYGISNTTVLEMPKFTTKLVNTISINFRNKVAIEKSHETSPWVSTR